MNEHDRERILYDDRRINAGYLRQFRRGNITEDEAKHAILFPVSVVNRYALALPAHVETHEEVEIAAVNPAAVLPPVPAADSLSDAEEGSNSGDAEGSHRDIRRQHVDSVTACTRSAGLGMYIDTGQHESQEKPVLPITALSGPFCYVRIHPYQIRPP